MLKSEHQKEEFKKKIKEAKMKNEMIESEKNFLEKQLKETRKKNKILKIAISKLTNEG